MEKCKNSVAVQTYKTFKNLLLQNYSAEFLDIATNSPWVCVNKVCSNGYGDTTYIMCEIILDDNLNIANLMQTLENLLLKVYSTEFFDIAHKQSMAGCY